MTGNFIKAVEDSFYLVGIGKELEHSLIQRGEHEIQVLGKRSQTLAALTSKQSCPATFTQKEIQTALAEPGLPNKSLVQPVGWELKMVLSGGRLPRTQGGPQVWKLP